jgi:hypothetical protein
VSAASTKRPRRSWTQLTYNQKQRAQAGQDAGQAGSMPVNSGTGYEILSYVIAGMVVYGGIGWLIGRAVHIGLLFPIGAVFGLALALGWIVYRYGVKGAEYGVKDGGQR